MSSQLNPALSNLSICSRQFMLFFLLGVQQNSPVDPFKMPISKGQETSVHRHCQCLLISCHEKLNFKFPWRKKFKAKFKVTRYLCCKNRPPCPFPSIVIDCEGNVQGGTLKLFYMQQGNNLREYVVALTKEGIQTRSSYKNFTTRSL